MRFDDRLDTVLAAGQTPGLGAQATWRQLVDLMGRERFANEAALIGRLRDLRGQVPVAVRTSSGRGLAGAWPSATLVGLFGEDEPVVAEPVLGGVRLAAASWLGLLPRLGPTSRGMLRRRKDLPAVVRRGLDSLGSVDRAIAAPITATDPPMAIDADDAAIRPPEPAAAPPPVGEPRSGGPASITFPIADLIARIDAYRHGWSERFRDPPPATTGGFRFVTDPAGTIRWVDGVGRAALVGASLEMPGPQGLVRIDAGAAAALRRRARFADIRLEVEGLSDAAGSWRISAVPRFDPATGRFVGYAGTGQRPATREEAPATGTRAAMSDGLRQLVHELRTPANAVMGFAELIETELLGPVPDPYRKRAHVIRVQAASLLAAIDDLDVAARIEGGALDLRPAEVPLGALIGRAVADLTPLARARSVELAASGDAVAVVDDRAADRLVNRLLAALVAAAEAGERIDVAVHTAGRHVVVTGTRPRAITGVPGEPLFTLDGMADALADDGGEGAPLLGISFTLRLVRNLAAELGGELTIDQDRLTLRLPAATRPVAMEAMADG
ncbi:HAMP domain-containing sensor histidine kinase [Sphingomonas cynarae]|uniref:sensor histidine kinase n=1 Tax=Sphingomonas cynarae TaxID=930197 RepID=UPI0031CF9CD8